MKVERLRDFKGEDIGIQSIEVPGGTLYSAPHGLAFVPANVDNRDDLIVALHAILLNLGDAGANADANHVGRYAWITARNAINKAARQ